MLRNEGWGANKLWRDLVVVAPSETNSGNFNFDLSHHPEPHQLPDETSGHPPPTASRQRGEGSLFKFLLFSSSNPPESFGSRAIFLWLELFLVVESVKRPPRGKLLCLEPHMGLVVNFFLQKSKHFVSPKLLDLLWGFWIYDIKNPPLRT